jgi:hypothetical protein
MHYAAGRTTCMQYYRRHVIRDNAPVPSKRFSRLSSRANGRPSSLSRPDWTTLRRSSASPMPPLKRHSMSVSLNLTAASLPRTSSKTRRSAAVAMPTTVVCRTRPLSRPEKEGERGAGLKEAQQHAVWGRSASWRSRPPFSNGRVVPAPAPPQHHATVMLVVHFTQANSPLLYCCCSGWEAGLTAGTGSEREQASQRTALCAWARSGRKRGTCLPEQTQVRECSSAAKEHGEGLQLWASRGPVARKDRAECTGANVGRHRHSRSGTT